MIERTTHGRTDQTFPSPAGSRRNGRLLARIALAWVCGAGGLAGAQPSVLSNLNVASPPRSLRCVPSDWDTVVEWRGSLFGVGWDYAGPKGIWMLRGRELTFLDHRLPGREARPFWLGRVAGGIAAYVVDEANNTTVMLTDGTRTVRYHNFAIIGATASGDLFIQGWRGEFTRYPFYVLVDGWTFVDREIRGFAALQAPERGSSPKHWIAGDSLFQISKDKTLRNDLTTGRSWVVPVGGQSPYYPPLGAADLYVWRISPTLSSHVELWRIPGAPANPIPSLVATCPGTRLTYLLETNSGLVFRTVRQGTVTTWHVQGGVTQSLRSSTGLVPNGLVRLGDRVLLFEGREAIAIDLRTGLAESLLSYQQARPMGVFTSRPAIHADRLYFWANGLQGDQVLSTDGTASGTRVELDQPPGVPELVLADRMFLVGTLGGVKRAFLWDRVPGHAPFLLQDLDPGSEPEAFTSHLNHLFFTAEVEGDGRVLCRTGLQPAITEPVRDAVSGNSLLDPRELHSLGTHLVGVFRDETNTPWGPRYALRGVLGDRIVDPGARWHDPGAPRELSVGPCDTLYFVADSIDSQQTGREPHTWTPRANQPGTFDRRAIRRLADVRPGPESSEPREFTAFAGRMYFTADDGVHGRELWMHDPATGAVQLVLDLVPGPQGSDPEGLTVGAGVLHFNATLPVEGRGFYSMTRLQLVRRLGPPASTDPLRGPLASRSFVIYAAETPAEGLEPWISVGTRAFLLKDVNPGPASSDPERWTEAGRRIVFHAHDGAHGRELHVTDGNASNTGLLVDLATGSASTIIDGLLAVSTETVYALGTRSTTPELVAIDVETGTVTSVQEIRGATARPGALGLSHGLLHYAHEDLHYGVEPFVVDVGPTVRRVGPAITNNQYVPYVQVNTPHLGRDLRLDAFNLSATGVSAILMDVPRSSIAFQVPGCSPYVSWWSLQVVPFQVTTNSRLSAIWTVTNDPALLGQEFWFAAWTADPVDGLQASDCLEVRF